MTDIPPEPDLDQQRQEGAALGREFGRLSAQASRRAGSDEERAAFRAFVAQQIRAAARLRRQTGSSEAELDAWLSGLQAAFLDEIEQASRSVKRALRGAADHGPGRG